MLDRIIPTPRVLLIQGRQYKVGQAQIKDLAKLHSWVAWAIGDPLTSIPAFDDDPDESTRKRRLRAAFDVAETWPPELSSRQSSEMLATPAGELAFLAIVLRKHRPRLSDARLLDLQQNMTSTEWRDVERAFWGTRPADTILAEIDSDWFKGDGDDWGTIFGAGLDNHWKNGRQFGELYLTELDAITNRGKLSERECVATPDGDTNDGFDWSERQRRKWYDPEELAAEDALRQHAAEPVEQTSDQDQRNSDSEIHHEQDRT